MNKSCAACGMLVGDGPRYHPYAACMMMKAGKGGNVVEANLRAVVEYGMKAQAAGVPLDVAMNDIGAIRRETAEGDG